MLHTSNKDYLVDLLTALKNAGLDNTIALITKAHIDRRILSAIRAIEGLRIVFCLSYSGLGRRLEPNFTDESLRANFEIVRRFGFPILHFWRPLLQENTSVGAIERMLSFVSKMADASVFVGFKLHPELTRIVVQDGSVPVPADLQEVVGEWLTPDTISRIYTVAQRICPHYAIYRHTSCALAKIMACPNHTGTVYRADICPPSQCPADQRRVCENARGIPSARQVSESLASLGRVVGFLRDEDGITIADPITQEEYSYLVQSLSFPLKARSVQMQNLYYGSIHEGQWTPIPASSS
jgi:hypothetical protein